MVDEIPMQVETRIDLDVTGQQRELVLGKPLLDGFIPISINSPLPARIETNGDLRVQARAGRHVIEVLARHPDPLEELTAPEQTSPWPSNEFWAFDARNDLRLVKVEGVPAVDPSRTQTPDHWRHLPIYSLTAGSTMRLNIIRRGDPDPEPDKYNLSRQIWLDFDGAGLTTQDYISGTISRRWRLESGPDLHLGQVVVDGEPRFISRREADGADSVELRRAQVNIVAEARMDRSRELAAIGWAQDFQSVQATLNLPPGWDVFAIDGVDNIPDTWIARWSLLDLFLVLVIAVTALRLWNPVFCAVTFVMLVLIWHAPDAPRYIWLTLFTLIALLKVLPNGWLRRVLSGLHGGVVIVLIVIVVPFAVHECRLAIYPQLEFPYPQFGGSERQVMAPARVEMMEDSAALGAPSPTADEQSFELDMSSSMAGQKLRSKSRLSAASAAPPQPSADDFFAIDPSAIIQTGPGIPQWQWKSLSLDWNGPVQQAQKISVTFIPPALSAVIHVMRVLMIAILLWLLFGARTRQLLKLSDKSNALMLLVGTIGLVSPTAQVLAADFPDMQLLETLRQRLNAPPDCGDLCADITRMRLDISAVTVQFRLEVNSGSASAIPLPGNAQQWQPQSVLVDGAASLAMARDSSGTLWVNVPAGVHQVVGVGVLPPRTNVQIALPLRPHSIELSVEGWNVDGVRDDGQVEQLLQLTRVGQENETHGTAVFAANQLPPFIRIERSLRLGLDWTLTTTVQRLANGSQAAVIAVPLILGEAVVTPGIEVSKGAVNVNLGPQTHQLVWQSVISKSESFTLTAPQTNAWLETWRVQASPMWHLEYSGIAPVHEAQNGADWIPQWRAWPGERVSFVVTKPSASPGQSLTIDSSRLTLNPGKRATDSHLSLQIRSSQGGQYNLGLPADIELQAVRINGQSQAARR